MNEPWIDNFRQEQAETGRRIKFALAWMLFCSCGVYLFLSQVPPSYATVFSQRMLLSVDLGQCSTSFAGLLIAHTLLAFLFTVPFFVLSGLSIRDATAGKGDAGSHVKMALFGLAAALIIIGLATGEGSIWSEHSPHFGSQRIHLGRKITLAEACAASEHVSYIGRLIYAFWTPALFGFIVYAMAVMIRWRILRDWQPDPQMSPALREQYEARLAASNLPPEIVLPKRALTWVEYGLAILVLACLATLAITRTIHLVHIVQHL